MATYKVLQDIEAEDKLLGPLTLKQFIFAGITIVLGVVQFKIITAPGSIFVKLPFLLLFFLPMLVFGFLAAPIGRDQPNDVWLLHRLRFYFKPHKRIWNQDGMSDLVTITVPKHIEHHLTNNLTQTEVSSRLQALANTIDSRGWAIKNVNVNLYAEPGYLMGSDESERLLSPDNLPQDVPLADVQAADDMLDARSNPTAQHLDQLMRASAHDHLQRIASRVHGTAADDPSLSTFGTTSVVSPGSDDDFVIPDPTTDELDAVARAADDDRQQPWAGHRTVLPIEEQRRRQQEEAERRERRQRSQADDDADTAKTTETATPNPAILELANNDDLNVATIARQANRITGSQSDDGEVVVPLH